MGMHHEFKNSLERFMMGRQEWMRWKSFWTVIRLNRYRSKWPERSSGSGSSWNSRAKLPEVPCLKMTSDGHGKALCVGMRELSLRLCRCGGWKAVRSPSHKRGGALFAIQRGVSLKVCLDSGVALDAVLLPSYPWRRSTSSVRFFQGFAKFATRLPPVRSAFYGAASVFFHGQTTACPAPFLTLRTHDFR